MHLLLGLDPALQQPAKSAIRSLRLTTTIDGPQLLVEAAGELDLASRQLAIDACVSGIFVHVVFDMTQLSFLDCSGYSGLMETHELLRRRGTTLTLRGQHGQVRRLLDLIDLIDVSAGVTR